MFGFEHRLILNMFYVWFRVSFDTQYVLCLVFRVSFDTQYVLVIVSRYRMILDMFQGYRFGSLYGYGLQGSG